MPVTAPAAYRGAMANSGRFRPHLNSHFDDELIGLDPQDPEAQAFAEHLDRMQHSEPRFTVEASISGIADFAESSHRAGGLRWWVAVVVVSLILLGVLVAAWEILSRAAMWL